MPAIASTIGTMPFIFVTSMCSMVLLRNFFLAAFPVALDFIAFLFNAMSFLLSIHFESRSSSLHRFVVTILFKRKKPPRVATVFDEERPPLRIGVALTRGAY